MAIKYYVCGTSVPQLNSRKIKAKCEEIEKFVSRGDDDVVNSIKDLCTAIVDIDDITRDKLKVSTLAHEVKTKALAFRKSRPLKTAAANDAGGP